MAEALAGAFRSAHEAMKSFFTDMSEMTMPDMDFSSGVSERVSGGVSLPFSLDFSKAKADLNSFLRTAGKTIRLHADASAVVSAGRSALEQLKSLYESTTLTLNAEASTGDGATTAATGGRFTSPTLTQIAEDGDPEYVIPVRKESLAVPLLQRLIGELSDPAKQALGQGLSWQEGTSSVIPPAEASHQTAAPNADAARVSAAAVLPVIPKPQQLFPSTPPLGQILSALPDLLASADHAAAPVVNQTTSQNVSAPVSIQVTAAGSSPEAVGRSIYNVAEQYLLRTLKSFA